MEKKKSKKGQGNFLTRFIKNIYVRNILLMAIAFIGLVFIVLFCLTFYTKHDETTIVPSLKGLQVAEAAIILDKADMKYEIVDSVDWEGGKAGSILDQLPIADSKVKKGRTIYLTVKSFTKPMLEIPGLIDFSQRAAEAQLNSLGFTKITIKEVPSIHKGLVISLTYKGKEVEPGEKLPKGAPLTLTVGEGGELNPDEVIEGETPVAKEDKTFFE